MKPYSFSAKFPKCEIKIVMKKVVEDLQLKVNDIESIRYISQDEQVLVQYAQISPLKDICLKSECYKMFNTQNEEIYDIDIIYNTLLDELAFQITVSSSFYNVQMIIVNCYMDQFLCKLCETQVQFSYTNTTQEKLQNDCTCVFRSNEPLLKTAQIKSLHIDYLQIQANTIVTWLHITIPQSINNRMLQQCLNDLSIQSGIENLEQQVISKQVNKLSVILSLQQPIFQEQYYHKYPVNQLTQKGTSEIQYITLESIKSDDIIMQNMLTSYQLKTTNQVKMHDVMIPELKKQKKKEPIIVQTINQPDIIIAKQQAQLKVVQLNQQSQSLIDNANTNFQDFMLIKSVIEIQDFQLNQFLHVIDAKPQEIYYSSDAERNFSYLLAFANQYQGIFDIESFPEYEFEFDEAFETFCKTGVPRKFLKQDGQFVLPSQFSHSVSFQYRKHLTLLQFKAVLDYLEVNINDLSDTFCFYMTRELQRVQIRSHSSFEQLFGKADRANGDKIITPFGPMVLTSEDLSIYKYDKRCYSEQSWRDQKRRVLEAGKTVPAQNSKNAQPKAQENDDLTKVEKSKESNLTKKQEIQQNQPSTQAFRPKLDFSAFAKFILITSQSQNILQLIKQFVENVKLKPDAVFTAKDGNRYLFAFKDQFNQFDSDDFPNLEFEFEDAAKVFAEVANPTPIDFWNDCQAENQKICPKNTKQKGVKFESDKVDVQVKEKMKPEVEYLVKIDRNEGAKYTTEVEALEYYEWALGEGSIIELFINGKLTKVVDGKIPQQHFELDESE